MGAFPALVLSPSCHANRAVKMPVKNHRHNVLIVRVFQVRPKSVNTVLGNRNIISLSNLDVSVAHLIAQNVRWSIEHGQLRPVSMPKVMVLEFNPVLRLQHTAMVLHGIDRLNLSFRQAIDQV